MRKDSKLKEYGIEVAETVLEYVFPRWIPLGLICVLILMKLLSYEVEAVAALLTSYNNLLSQEILSSDVIESLIGFPVMLIGVYITVISVFGIGFSKATVLLSESNAVDKFIKYAQVSILSAIILLFSTILHEVISWDNWSIVYLIIILWATTNFLRFIIITLRMYTINIREANQIERKSDELMKTLIHEVKLLRQENIGKEYASNDYFEELVRTNEKKKEESK